MKHLLYILIIVLLSGCLKQNNNEIKDGIQNENGIQLFNHTRYVIATEGLRVRNSPNLDGEIIYILDSLAEVFFIYEDNNIVNIDNINGKWTFIESGDIQGWVFGGYLSLIEPLRIQNMNTFNKTGEQLTYIINSICEYIYNDLNLIVARDINSLEEFLSIMNFPKEYEIISKTPYSGQDGGIMYEYIIRTNLHKLTVWANERILRYGISEILIELNNDNYLDLFPYSSMEEYLTDDSFGRVLRHGIDVIVYHVTYSDDPVDIEQGDYWSLEFKNGLLHSIKFVPYRT
jgi:hypothetical protein